MAFKTLKALALSAVLVGSFWIPAANYEAGVPKMIKLIKAECARTGFSERWALAFFFRESSFRAGAVSWEPSVGAEAWGAGQVLLSTARSEMGFKGSVEELLTPEVNVALVVRFLAKLDARFCGDKEKVFRYYNGGPRALSGSVDNREYYERIKKSYKEL